MSDRYVYSRQMFVPGTTIQDVIAGAVATERDACMKDVCRYCRDDVPVRFVKPPSWRGIWYHSSDGKTFVVCLAAAIRDRG